MAKPRKLTDAQRDRVLFLLKTIEMRPAEVAKECEVSEASVGRIGQFYDIASKQGVRGIIEVIGRNSSTNKELVEWALNRAGVKVSDAEFRQINAAFNEVTKRNVPPNVEVVVKESPENDLTAFIKLVQQLEVIANQNKVIIETLKSGFESVADAIAALASDIKDNTNLNSDLVCERLKEQTDILNGIKANTRKKGL